ncbi:MAG: 50S ribosomal protein L25 [Bacteroidia bacterium]
MKTTELKAHKRENVGKRAAKDLRTSGNIPGVVYDEQNATHIYVDAKEVAKVLYTQDTYVISLNVDGSTTNAIVRDAEYHPVTERVLHVEFLKVTESKKVKVFLPVKLTGTPVGVSKGGKLTTKVRKLLVKGIPSKLPDVITVDVSHLDLGQTIKVGHASLGDLEILTSASAALASVEIPRALRSTVTKGN